MDKGDGTTAIVTLSDVFVGSTGEIGQVIIGTTGPDSLLGTSGPDTLIGDDGDDFLVGGEGADTFEFGLLDGNDTIEDFQVGTDDLDLLDGLTVTSIVDQSDIGGGATSDMLVNLSDGTTVTLLDTGLITEADLMI